MAERLDDSEIEDEINSSIDRQIEFLNKRRGELLTEARRKRQDKEQTEKTRIEKVRQLIEAQEQLQGSLKENSFSEMRSRMVKELEERILVMRESIKAETHLVYECEEIILQDCICNFGNIIERKGVKPIYGAFHSHDVVTWRAEDDTEVVLPFGVAIDNTTNQIFVADHIHGIQIFSEKGVPINHFGREQLKSPWGIAIDRMNIFVCDWGHHALFLFNLLDLTYIKTIGKFGSENGEFKWPRQIDVCPKGLLYVADCFNDRISVFEQELTHVRNIKHALIVFPSDVKLTRDKMYVLTERNATCIHVFNHAGEHVRSLISQGEGQEVTGAWFFCLDVHCNLVISDMGGHCIKVFTKDGQLIHTVGQQRQQQQQQQHVMLHESKGVAISLGGKLVCVSNTKNASLQIFF